MSAIIWWLESPWQLRALVFILSFFVCFVGPWLHSQSLLSSGLAARKPSEEKSEAVSASKPETPLAKAQAQREEQVPPQALPHKEPVAAAEKARAPVALAPVEAKVPAQQQSVAAEQKAPAASAPLEEKVPAQQQPVAAEEKAVAPATPTPAEEKAPAQQQQVVAEEKAVTPATQAPADEKVVTQKEPVAVEEKAPAPVTSAPVEEKAPAQQKPVAVEEKAPAPLTSAPVEAKAPAQQQPVVAEEKASAPATPAPAEAKAPPKQEQAAAQAPAAAASAIIPGAFDIIRKGENAIPAASSAAVEKQEFTVSSEKGGSADVEVHLLSTKAGPGVRRSDRSAGSAGRRTDLAGALDSDTFAKAAALYDTVVCVGLGSRSATASTQEIARLIENRAVHLCGIIARKPYISANTKLYGLSLAQPLDGVKAPDKEKPKSLMVIGIKSAKGDLTDLPVQKKMISELIREGKIASVPLGSSSEVASGNELRYIEVKSGNVLNKSRPVKLQSVRPDSGVASEALQGAGRRQKGSYRGQSTPAHHKKCGRHTRIARNGTTSKPILPLSKTVSKAPAEAETGQWGCGIFDFPF